MFETIFFINDGFIADNLFNVARLISIPIIAQLICMFAYLNKNEPLGYACDHLIISRLGLWDYLIIATLFLPLNMVACLKPDLWPNRIFLILTAIAGKNVSQNAFIFGTDPNCKLLSWLTADG